MSKVDKLKYIMTRGFIWGFRYCLIYSILTMIFNPRGTIYSFDQILVRFVSYLIIFSLGGILVTSITLKFNTIDRGEK